jgi:hypothetical protein
MVENLLGKKTCRVNNSENTLNLKDKEKEISQKIPLLKKVNNTDHLISEKLK